MHAVRRLVPALLIAVFAVTGCGAKETVRESILPGVSMALPWGGLACDPAVNAALGGGTLGPKIKAICASRLEGVAVVAMYPMGAGVLSVMVVDEHTIPFPALIDSEKPQDKEAVRISLCRSLQRKSVALDSSCEVSRMTIAGHIVPVARGVGSMNANKTTNILRAVAIPYRGGTALMMAGDVAPAAKPPGAAENAAPDAMIASIELDPSVK